MSKFSIYPFGNARAGSHFPILSPRFSKFVTSRFSQPWKFSCDQQLGAERKSVKGLKTPLISWTPHSGAFTGSVLGHGADRGSPSCRNDTDKELFRGLRAALFSFCFLLPKLTYNCCIWRPRAWVLGPVDTNSVWFRRGHLLYLGLTLPIRELKGLDCTMAKIPSSSGLTRQPKLPRLSCPHLSMEASSPVRSLSSVCVLQLNTS